MKKILFALSSLILLACGDDSEKTSSPDLNDEYSSSIDYDLEDSSSSVNDDGTSSDSSNENFENATSSSSLSDLKDTVIKNASITGSATKGPFKFGSPVTVYELHLENLSSRTGRVYNDEVSSNQGNYVIPKVTLLSPYAELTVVGPFLSEVTGKNTDSSFTLRSIADLSESGECNINILTHLQANRILKLVEKGYTFAAAKKQAEQEVMTSFNLANTVAAEHSTIYNNATMMAISLLFLGNRSEDEFRTAIDNYINDLEKDGQWNDSITKAQMADWVYDADWLTIHKNVDAWNIVDIADFHAEALKYRNNMWGLGGCTENRKDELATVTNTESTHLHECFKCGVKTSSDKWINAAYAWHTEPTISCDTKGWAAGKEGEIKEGSVSPQLYVYEAGAWRKSSALEDSLGTCIEANQGEVGKISTTYYICKNRIWSKATAVESVLGGCVDRNADSVASVQDSWYICRNGAWRNATALEYDTFGWSAGQNGEVKKGSVTDTKYVYRADMWQRASFVEATLGSCLNSTEGTVEKCIDSYYICKSNLWDPASVIEYDTYGWKAGVDGETKKGNATSTMYVYDAKTSPAAWRKATTLESELGGCVTANTGEVSKSGSIWYICKNRTWTTATKLEYDTYGLDVSKGTVQQGVVTSIWYIYKNGAWTTATTFEYDTYGWKAGADGETKKGNVSSTVYVYDAATNPAAWREATSLESEFGGCVTANEGNVTKVGSTWYICKNRTWTTATTLEYDTYGWKTGIDGETKKGNVTSTIYVYDASTSPAAWREATSLESELGGCVTANAGNVTKIGSTWYICKNRTWATATKLEYDTYGLDATKGTVQKGVVTGTWYIYKNGTWTTATKFEYDTYGWKTGADGETKNGNITSTVYVYDAAANPATWREATAVESKLGGCVTANAGNVTKVDSSWYICKNRTWTLATKLEYDTYEWSEGVNNEVRNGLVNTDIVYVYEDGKWRLGTMIDSLMYEQRVDGGKACTKSALNDTSKVKANGLYYVCSVGIADTAYHWTPAGDLYNDTYEARSNCSPTTDGNLMNGRVNMSKIYACNGETGWTEVTDGVSKTLGGCYTNLADSVGMYNSVYYLCLKGSWVKASEARYNTTHYECKKNGEILKGLVDTTKYFTCDADSFRVASSLEAALKISCGSYNDNETLISPFNKTVWTCSKRTLTWDNVTIAGTMFDSRDNIEYRTTAIGSQIWMAENLKGITTTTTLSCQADSCSKYGGYFGWKAAKSACPEGWHLPSRTEWNTLFSAVGGATTAGYKLKATSGWKNGTNGSDSYGFSVFAAGIYNRRDRAFLNIGKSSIFWTSTQYSSTSAYNVDFQSDSETRSGHLNSENYGLSVRCVKD